MSFGTKMRFKFKDKKIVECYGCKKIGHWKKDCPNKSRNSSSTNVVQSDGLVVKRIFFTFHLHSAFMHEFFILVAPTI